MDSDDQVREQRNAQLREHVARQVAKDNAKRLGLFPQEYPTIEELEELEPVPEADEPEQIEEVEPPVAVNEEVPVETEATSEPEPVEVEVEVATPEPVVEPETAPAAPKRSSKKATPAE